MIEEVSSLHKKLYPYVWENSSLMLKGQDYVLLALFYVQVLECSMQYCVHNVLELDRIILTWKVGSILNFYQIYFLAEIKHWLGCYPIKQNILFYPHSIHHHNHQYKPGYKTDIKSFLSYIRSLKFRKFHNHSFLQYIIEFLIHKLIIIGFHR